MHPALATVDHRPFPLPAARWTWRQTWRDLLFAHWPVDADVLRPLIPDVLEIDTHAGQAWLGVVPFRMTGVMRRPLPDLPGISAFPELNVRTYVRHGDRAGVWFLSLDATNALAVWAARQWFHLPYHRAQMRLTADGAPDGEDIVYASDRRDRAASFHGRYGPTGPVTLARAGTLDHWLTERYGLFACSPRGVLSWTEVHHEPWPLQPAQATIDSNSMGAPHGLSLDGPPAHLHFARRLDVVVWNPVTIDT